MPRAHRPLVRWLKYFTMLVIGLVAGLAGLFWLALHYSPTTVITPIVRYAAKQQGFELLALRLGEDWLSKDRGDLIVLSPDSLLLENSETAIELSDLSLEFTLSDALQGRFESLTIGELNLTSLLAAPALGQTQKVREQIRTLLLASVSESSEKTDQALSLSARSLPLGNKRQNLSAAPILAQASEFFSELHHLPFASLSIDSMQVALLNATGKNLVASAAALEFDSSKAAVNFTAALFDDSDEQAIAAQGNAELNFASGALVSGRLDLSVEASANPQTHSPHRLNLSLEQIALNCSAEDHCQIQAQVTADLARRSAETPALRVEAIEAGKLGIEFFAVLAESAERLSVNATQLRASVDPLSRGNARAKLSLDIPDFQADLGESRAISAGFTLHATQLTIPGLQADAAVIAGELSLQQAQAKLKLSLASVDGAETPLSLALRHSLESASGSAELRFNSPALSPQAPLSDIITLPMLGVAAESADLLAGTLSSDATFAWQQLDAAAWELGGEINLRVVDLSGFYAETIFVDAASELAAKVDLRLTPTAQGEWEPRIALRSVTPAHLSVGSLDTGFVLERARATYEFTASSDFSDTRYALSARNLRADFLGGELAMAALAVNERAMPESFNLVLSGVDLGAVVELASYPELNVQGSVSGVLPLRLAAGQSLSAVTVTKGLISALKPGGSIRYSPLGAVTANQSLQLVNEALANYQFSTLDTTLDIDENGEIDLGVVLAGANPDMNGGQAINLNVNISDNLVDLLASLRASRELSEELELRLQRK